MSHARYRYVPCSRPLCQPHARKPQMESPFGASLLFGLSPLQFSERNKNMASSRYVRQTEEEMERLLSEKDSKNTKRTISTSVKCFRYYLQLMALIRNLNRSKLVFLTVGWRNLMQVCERQTANISKNQHYIIYGIMLSVKFMV